MIEQVLPDIFRIEIPLPRNPLRATNSYFIRGQKRNLLVDTGFNCEPSREAMVEALDQLNISMKNTDILVTHLHADHAGLISFLATPDTKVYMHEADAMVVGKGRESSNWKMFNVFLKSAGLLHDGVEDNVENHPGYRYGSEVFKRFTMVTEGYEIKVGDYCFTCLETNGHTPGHICLYDEKKKLLLSGDHILGTITPNITLWQLGVDVLGNYLKSLDHVAAMDIEIVLPGHRGIIYDCRGRINELKEHHRLRLENVLDILGGRSMNGAEVASQMKWDLSYRNWQDFPWGQKLFATGEAMSHLYHLFCTGVLSVVSDDGVFYFKKR